ncbi:MAG: ABC transporter permease, partial [Desulfobacteraceae bacterium]
MASEPKTIFMDNGKSWITGRLLPSITLADLREWLLPITSLVVVLAIWQLICTLLSVPEFVLPSPARILAEISTSYGYLFKHTAITLGEAGAGFIIANMLSFVFALAFCYSPFFEKSGYPYMIAFQSIPLVALTPLINLWFGEGVISKIVMAGLITFFPMVVNATHGLKAVPPLSLDVMKSLSATELQILSKLRIPTALPYILSALRISAPLAV